jgi:probable F420-dependent oxidoreductase
MGTRPFRFGLVAGQADSAGQWTETARRAEQLGYDVLLVPDTPNIISPFPALAAAAAVTSTIRLGTFVVNVPLRQPGSLAWDSASVDRLSDGRFELGLGAGRADGDTDADRLGLPWGTPGQRVGQLAEAITTVRATFATAAEADPSPFGGVNHLDPVQDRLPIMVAGAGDRLLGLAAREADIVAIGAAGSAGETELAQRVDLVRAQAGDRFDQLELSTNVFSVGDGPIPPWLSRFGVSPELSTDNRVLAVLNGEVGEMCEVLERRRERYGISYVTVNSLAVDAFVPVLERLRGQ